MKTMNNHLQTQKAEARVEINPDKTRAVLILCKGAPGSRPLEMKVINQAIKESGVHGFDAEQLNTAIKAFMEGEELVLSDYVLAEGIPSTRGKDREVQVFVTQLPEEEKGPILTRLKTWFSRKASTSDEFDLQETINLAFVEKGSLVARVCEGSEGETGKDIFGNIIPGLPGNDPDIKLKRGLLQHGSEITASKSGLLIFEASEKSFFGDLVDYQDAKIRIDISEDGMVATGNFILEEGAGIPLTVENVQKVLSAFNIKKGIIWESVKNACVQARSGKQVMGIVLARGEPPITPGASAYKWLIRIKPPELEDNDFQYEPGGVNSFTGGTALIKAGTPIIEFSELFPEGRPGYDVKGIEIPIDRGEALALEHDESVREVKFEKGRRLIAARSGELSFDGKNLKICSIKSIQGDVSEKINFSGEIQIEGNVQPGAVLMGGSHVIVDGLAERALISAEGKVVVTKGFKGGGKGTLRARAGIKAAFVERAAVMAVGDIQLELGSILSSIKTNGKLTVLQESGKLSGGVCQARYGIDTADLGSPKGLRTEISFGQDYFLKGQLDACEGEIAKIKDLLTKMDEKFNQLLTNKQALPENLRKEKVRLVKLQEQLNLKAFTLREKFEEHFDTEIRIRGNVFPGVVIESHNRYYVVKQKRSQVVFYFDRESGRIKEKPLSEA